ncbi:spore maturation protein CgeB [Haloferula luteola]|uniref:Spore maturation protein CgeB n=1 Tax=Haloferula luteola TaxID=595692 RepID=A0A840VIX2_9BACT|nr:glycosyltransferase [Haloferula luteola]MBB5352651.1 spore maturation protein CgeB [Haloferula luteola]
MAFGNHGLPDSRGLTASGGIATPSEMEQAKARPRVAVVGKSRSILTWFEDLQQGFQEAGAEVLGIGTQALNAAERWAEKREGRRDLENPAVVDRMIAELENFAPDLVVFQNRGGLVNSAWERLAPSLKNTHVVGWLCDHMGGVPHGQEACFDQVYYFDSGCIPALEKFYGSAAPLSFLPLAVNPERYPWMGDRPRKPAVVFAGKCSQHRRALFDRVKSEGLPIEVFGPGCRDFLRPWRGRRISSGSLAKIYASYLGCLSPLQPGNTECGLNLRAFEAPCSGGAVLYPEVPDLPLCFEPGKEVIGYDDFAGLAVAIRHLLANPEYADQVARAGRERVLAEHTFLHRARRLLGEAGM